MIQEKKIKKGSVRVNIALNPEKFEDKVILDFLSGLPLRYYAAKAIKSLAAETIMRTQKDF